MRKYIGFVILTWNSQAYIEDCLRSIDAMQGMNTAICVVDNGSTDGTKEILTRLKNEMHTKLHIVELPENKGTTISRNIGIDYLKQHTEVNYLVVLDSDTIINEQAIQRCIELLDSDQHVGIVGPKLVSCDGSVQNSGRRLPTITLKLLKVLPIASLRQRGETMEKIPAKGDTYPVGYLMSACWVMRAALVDTIGPLDENIFYAPEDVEYCLRAWQAGYSVLYTREASITHIWQRLSRKKLFSKHNYEHIKGLIYLWRKYGYALAEPSYIHYEE